MKLKTLVFGVALGLAALTTQKAAAFPINLTALGGTITSTAYYGSNDATTTNKAKVVAVNLKTVLTVVSNEVVLQNGTNNAPPANSRIAYDPYKFQTYLTNNNGYFQDLGGIVRMEFSDIATTFHQVGTNGGVESDVMMFYFKAEGRGTDGLYYQFSIGGRGKLAYSVNGKTGRATMAASAAGSNRGTYKDSEAGVSTGSVVFSGSGTPEWEGPYSVYWANNAP